jgi:tetratricopeptide (TPR) repeat protein
VLLVLSGPVFMENGSARGSVQDAQGDTWALLFRWDDEAAREKFAEARGQRETLMAATVGSALTRLPQPYDGGSYPAGREVLLSFGATREARQASVPAGSDRAWLRLLEAAFGAEQAAPAWSELILAAEALGTTGVLDQRTAWLLAARLVVSAPVTGADAPQSGVSLRLVAALEEVAASTVTDEDARHYLVRLYLRRGEAAQARRHARQLLTRQPAPRVAEAALRALTAAGDWAAASDAMKRVGPTLPTSESARQLWLAYLLLQEGRMGEAEALLRPLWAIPPEAALSARMVQARARALWVIESRRWIDARLAPSMTGMDPDVVAGELLSAGMAGVRVGNQQQAMDALTRMALLVGDGDQALPTVTTARPAASVARPGVNRPGVAPIPTSRPMRPGATGTAVVIDDPALIRLGLQRRRAAVMAQQMEAYSLFAEGRRDEAIVLARQAAAVAAELPSDSVWPAPVKPSHELVGDFLLEARRPLEAMVAYQDSLNRWPLRSLSLLGLYRAAVMARDVERAAAARAQLASVWARGDRSWSEIAEILGAVRR